MKRQFLLAPLLFLLPQLTTAQTPNTFVSTGTMSTARAEHTATLLLSGKVLIAWWFGLHNKSSDGRTV